MKTHILETAVKTLVPSLLGAAGALAATVFPSYYHAVCGGVSILPSVF